MEGRGITTSSRSKEKESDYRYFPEPDLRPLRVKSWMDKIELPELPDARRERFVEQYGISLNHARTLTGDIRVANFYEKIADSEPVLAATWVADTLLGELNYRNMKIERVPDGNFSDLIVLLNDGEITDRVGVDVLRIILDQLNEKEECEMPSDIVTRLGLGKAKGDEFGDIIAEIVDSNPKPVSDYKSGKEGALNFLVGQVMKQTRGRADPKVLNVTIREYIDKKDNGVNTYRFDDVIALGLRGHVVEIDFEPGYSNWRSETNTPRTLIDAGIIKKATEKKIVNLIKKLAKKADLVTIATDYDREGELIGKEVYEIVRNVSKDVQINRTRFSAITPPEIINAFTNPAKIDFDLAAAGEARQIIDLIWGASLTRFISIAAKRGGSNILSVGRVQSPTLAMIVDREKEIEAFIPKPYWMLSVDTEKSGQTIEARYTNGKFWEYTPAKEAEERTQEPLEVIEIKEGTKNDRAPTPFDTTGFIVAAARLNLSAANAMRIAEELYMNGQISYPRTDNTIYPASLDLKEILEKLLKSPFKREVQWVQAHQRTEPTRGKKSSTDHPPIHPTGAAKKEQMDERHWKVYELVVRRFLATLSPDAKWKTIKCMLDASGESYTATGSRLAEEGYRHVYTYSGAKDNILPELSVGEKLPINSVNLEEKATQPPPRYSQSKLIQEMEKLGLGTKSTRHEIIGKLVSRRYIEDTPLKPSLVGMAVIESLESHAELITKPDMTQTLESHMNKIKSSLLSRDGVVDESRKMLHQVFNELEANEVLIGEEIMERTDEERILGKCPVCGHNLRIMRTKGMSQFIGCSGYPECSFNLGRYTG